MGKVNKYSQKCSFVAVVHAINTIKIEKDTLVIDLYGTIEQYIWANKCK